MVVVKSDAHPCLNPIPPASAGARGCGCTSLTSFRTDLLKLDRLPNPLGVTLELGWGPCVQPNHVYRVFVAALRCALYIANAHATRIFRAYFFLPRLAGNCLSHVFNELNRDFHSPFGWLNRHNAFPVCVDGFSHSGATCTWMRMNYRSEPQVLATPHRSAKPCWITTPCSSSTFPSRSAIRSRCLVVCQTHPH